MKFPFKLGPGVLVTAAFIGPGTVMTASRAGATFGFTVLWAVAFSVITAITLQAMAARLGVVTKKGLAEAIGSSFANDWMQWPAIGLILSAILIGNSAYQAGNLLGAAEGLRLLTPVSAKVWVVAIAAIAMALIWVGRYSVLQLVLTVLVAAMGLIFVASAILCGPQLFQIANGFRPAIPAGAEWVIVGLIGTTVVPYNLFLHASAAAQKYDADDTMAGITHSFWDTVVSIVVGGIITASLLITAAVAFDGTDTNSIDAEDIANQLRPAMGSWAQYAFAIGLFAAGLTSSITAPVAAALATAGCFGWDTQLSNPRIKMIASLVIAIGLSLALVFGKIPTQTIVFAQVANGLLLPIVAIFLLYALNRKSLLGQYCNSWLANALGVFVIAITLVLATREFNKVWTTLSTVLQ